MFYFLMNQLKTRIAQCVLVVNTKMFLFTAQGVLQRDVLVSVLSPG